MRYLTFLFAIAQLASLSAQDTVIHYFDYSWEATTPAYAQYFKVAYKKDSLWHFKGYYAKGQLQSQGTCIDSALEKTHGDFVSYFKNGQKNETGAYVFGVKTGEWIYRHKSGYPRSAGSYDEQGEQTGPWKSWFENGRVDSEGEFVNDEKHGTWTYYHRNSQVSSFEKYEHGELKNVQSWDEQGKVVDADYEVERMPEFPGGVKALYQHLSQQIAYPPKARQEGIEGKVYVEFTIDTDGSIEDATVVKGSHPLLNAAAVKAVSKLPKWKPGIQHNRIVKVKYTLPVNFQLK